MKKYIAKIISIIICLTISLSLFACSPEEQNGGANTTGQNSSAAYNEFIDTYVDTVNKEDVTDSSEWFIKDGKSDYSILVSRNEYSSKVEETAANEMNFFINDAYGFKLPVVFDNEVGDYDTSKKYISIGYTKFYEESPMNGELDFAVLGNDGYKIQTYDNLVIINAVGNNGILYGGYGFLERNLGYRYYFKDEWAITKEPNVLLKNMDVVSVPEFASRYLDTATNSSANSDIVNRLRFHGSQGGAVVYEGMEGGGWIGSDQSLCLQFLPWYKYQKNHGNWFTGDGNTKSGQMCIATVMDNQPHEYDEMRPLDEMLKNIIQNYIIPNPTKRVFMFGINDNANFQCKCEKCLPEVTEILYSGQMCLLLNAVKDALTAWQNGATHFPGGTPIPEEIRVTDPTSHDATRTLLLSFFAYLYCIEAPVTYDAVTDSYKVREYDAVYECLGGDGENGDGDYDDLELHEDIIVRIAPIESVNMHTHYDREYNEIAYNAFEAWSQIAAKMSVWDYGTTFSDYISPYPDWGIIVDDFKYFRAKNVTELLTQLPAHTSGTSFFAMMMYVRAQLMWDMDQDIEWLFKDFMYNYYGPQAFDDMYAYFTFLRNYMQMADSGYFDKDGMEVKGFINANGVRVEYHGYIYEVFTTERWFPMVTLMKLKEFFTSAEAKLELVKNTEPKYQKYLDRVQVESLFTRYMDLKNFRSYYSNEQVAQMTDEFERIAALGNLTQTSNAGKNGVMQIQDFIANLRRGIS